MRTINELKRVYLDTLENILEENFDLANATLQAKINNKDTDNKFYEVCNEKMREAMTQDEYRLLEPHLMDLGFQIAKLVLLRMQKDKK